MKKRLPVLLALCLAFVLCLALAACNNDKTQNKLESGNVVAEGDFAEGVTLATSKLEATDDNYKAAITKIADKDYDKEKTAVYDISLVKDNAKVQPNGKVKITMPAPFTTENGYVTYHIKGETVEELETFLEGGKISFETTSFSYFVVAGKADESTPVYTLVDKDGKEDADGGYVLFGSYPQTAVDRYDTTTLSALNVLAGTNPSDGYNGKWTSYKYYYAKMLEGGDSEPANEIDFMWYIDVNYKGERYRGVYFDKYRPTAAKGSYNVLKDGKTESISCAQITNRYFVDKVYWFKYEPILWKIVGEADGKARLLCMTAVDCQPYTLVIRYDTESLHDDVRDDNYTLCYNDSLGVPTGTLGTDYEYSTVRDWLNNYFYQKAFDSAEQSIVCDTVVDNVTGEVGNNTTDKVFIPSLAEVKDESDLYRKASDYAKSQGTSMKYGGTYCYSWYLRDTYYVLRFQDKKDVYVQDHKRYYQLCSVNEGAAYAPNGAPCFMGAEGTSTAVVPSLWITL